VLTIGGQHSLPGIFCVFRPCVQNYRTVVFFSNSEHCIFVDTPFLLPLWYLEEQEDLGDYDPTLGPHFDGTGWSMVLVRYRRLRGLLVGTLYILGSWPVVHVAEIHKGLFFPMDPSRVESNLNVNFHNKPNQLHLDPLKSTGLLLNPYTEKLIMCTSPRGIDS